MMTTPKMDRQDSSATDFKADIERHEMTPGLDPIGEDNDQVGYNTFRAAQESGIEVVSSIAPRIVIGTDR